MTDSMLSTAMNLLAEIESLGDYTALIVGGTPRDLILGREINDVDIATNCPIEILSKHFQTYDIGKSKDFGIVVLIYEGLHFEVAQFRADEKYSDCRHPDKVSIVGDFYTDSCRRDFTCNALGLNKKGEVIDHHNGIKDIENKVIRTVGDPNKRFSEDYLRILRAARFSSVLDFSIERKTRIAIRRNSKRLRDVPMERVKAEMEKTAKHGGKVFARFLLVLDKLWLITKILPEVSALKYLKHKLKHHPEGLSVFTHVVKCIEVCRTNDPIVLFSALFHDVGKAVVFTEVDGYPKYLGHDEAGLDVIKEVGQRLKFSNYELDAILFASKHHMKFHNLKDMKPSKIATIVNDPFWPVLLEVGRADEMSRGEDFTFAGSFDSLMEVLQKIKESWEEREYERCKNIVSGTLIMELTGLAPSPLVGRIKKAVEETIIDNNIDHTDLNVVGKLIIEEAKKVV